MKFKDGDMLFSKLTKDIFIVVKADEREFLLTRVFWNGDLTFTIQYDRTFISNNFYSPTNYRKATSVDIENEMSAYLKIELIKNYEEVI